MSLATKPQTRIGVDIGGTFTDLASVDDEGVLRVSKILTSHGEEESAVLTALDAVKDAKMAAPPVVAHGTTLVINALLERKGAHTALVTTEGFGDLLDIGRANRPQMFNLRYRRDEPFIETRMHREIGERMSASGETLQFPTAEAIGDLVAWIREVEAESVAIAFLNAYVNPSHERQIADALARELPGMPITLSSDMSRHWREYERFNSAAANAYVLPSAKSYLGRLESRLESAHAGASFFVLDSNGGLLEPETASQLPLRLVESGPVAGVVGARDLGIRHGIERIVTFDMGGTTAKSALVEGDRISSTELYWIGGYATGLPVQVPTIDIIEVGAGGGSIAWLDDANRLQVGPRSAGSQPGPACYGLGGTEPTITDANVYCGRLLPVQISDGIVLSKDQAADAIETVAEKMGVSARHLAVGILKVANLTMAAAVRRQTLERGLDPREFTMVAMGGAGPMHACDVADEVGIRRVIVPQYPGHFCALGMLGADLQFEETHIIHQPLHLVDWSTVSQRIAVLEGELTLRLAEATSIETTASICTVTAGLRYEGQEHALRIPFNRDELDAGDARAILRQTFEAEYGLRYGHINATARIELLDCEVVAVRTLPRPLIESDGNDAGQTHQNSPTSVDVVFDTDGELVSCRVIERGDWPGDQTLEGPLIIQELGATTVVPTGWSAHMAADGALVIEHD
ncbi:hydantoinase/oxoprolinase family protein [Subtercola lobariae]|uniref:5-oxoprolinase n=1 Tax=Subtercola lobariae TaxID=1588641 RepID=A0A917B565_9MICO|nr:hydantoinase/oxoprolinase family protein [Subtercola lobariae]GGF22656.1 5-oxoprolinase [Subtercola lobariae]